MRCRSVGCGMPGQTPSRTLSATRCTEAVHIDAMIRLFDESGAVIETHEHIGDFKVW